MLDADRIQARAEDAQIRSEMARTRLLLALAAQDELIGQWQDVEKRRFGAEDKGAASVATARLPS